MAIFRKKNKPIKLESESQLQELARSGKPVLVDFWQYGCQPCRVMDGIVRELAEEFADEAHIVMADAAVAGETFQKYKIRSTPTFIVFTAKEGANAITQRWRASGMVKKDVLTRALESAAS